MFISSVSAGNVASTVWSALTRNLTGFGSTALADASNPNVTILASGTLALLGNAGGFLQITVAFIAGAAGTVTIFGRPSVGAQILSIAAGTPGGISFNCGSAVGWTIQNNDAINFTQGLIAGMRFQQ